MRIRVRVRVRLRLRVAEGDAEDGGEAEGEAAPASAAPLLGCSGFCNRGRPFWGFPAAGGRFFFFLPGASYLVPFEGPFAARAITAGTFSRRPCRVGAQRYAQGHRQIESQFTSVLFSQIFYLRRTSERRSIALLHTPHGIPIFASYRAIFNHSRNEIK